MYLKIDTRNELETYIRRIRNSDKREYAKLWMAYRVVSIP